MAVGHMLARNRLGGAATRPRASRQELRRTSGVQARSRNVRLNAVAVQQQVEEIDPFTGQPINPQDVTAPIAGYQVKAGNLTWRYRKNTPAAERASPDNPPVLLLHGIGSSSYTWRNMMLVLAALGYEAYAPDWIGYGDSDKPAAGAGFGYTADDYVKALKDFVAAVGIKTPFIVMTQGYVLGQYSMLYALEQEELVERMVLFNTPLAVTSKLRPELAPYKSPLPFLRPGNRTFAADIYMATGTPFEFQYRDAQVFQRPYDTDPAASAALAATMDALDWDALLKRVDQGYRNWKTPTLLVFGSADPFIKLNDVYKFLDTKRTCMRLQPLEGKLGHNPQEDDVLMVAPTVAKFMNGALDNWQPDVELLRVGKLWEREHAERAARQKNKGN